jgi:hypothetical protein
VTQNPGDGLADDPTGRLRAPLWQPPVEAPGASDEEDARPSAASRAVSIVLAFVVGVVYGAVGTVAHPLSITIASVTVPWGLILAVVGVLALFVGFRLVLGERLAVVAAAVGVVGIVALFSLESAGGSVLIPQSSTGLIWVLAPALLAALVIFWPSLPAPAGRRGGTGAPIGDGRLDQPDAKEFPTP